MVILRRRTIIILDTGIDLFSDRTTQSSWDAVAQLHCQCHTRRNYTRWRIHQLNFIWRRHDKQFISSHLHGHGALSSYTLKNKLQSVARAHTLHDLTNLKWLYVQSHRASQSTLGKISWTLTIMLLTLETWLLSSLKCMYLPVTWSQPTRWLHEICYT